jgi:hypothetical protein
MRPTLPSLALAITIASAACGPTVSGADTDARPHPDGAPLADAPPMPDGPNVVFPDAPSSTDSYTVYAHADHVLYRIDLQTKMLVTVGPFHAPTVDDGHGNQVEDTITDLAVATDGTIYVNSRQSLYTADPNDGHVTKLTSIGNCGNFVVALSFTIDGTLTAGDFSGDYCTINTSVNPATTTKVGTLGMNMALAGDIVAVDDGTMYGTAVDMTMSSSNQNNYLVKLDPHTGAVIQKIGQTGFPSLFGLAYAEGQVFGFTHDGSGRVITIDPTTGHGTVYGTFMDPSTHQGIAFAGAGVNPMVPAIP